MNQLSLHCLKGFSAIDMLTVFSITCVCVVAGTPFLSNYAVRTKLTEAITAADGARTAVTITCMEEPNLANLDNRATGYTFDGGQYVSNVEVGGSCTRATIKLLTMNTGAHPDPTLTLTGISPAGDTRMGWTCSGTGPALHLPEGCRH